MSEEARHIVNEMHFGSMIELQLHNDPVSTRLYVRVINADEEFRLTREQAECLFKELLEKVTAEEE